MSNRESFDTNEPYFSTDLSIDYKSPPPPLEEGQLTPADAMRYIENANSVLLHKLIAEGVPPLYPEAL